MKKLFASLLLILGLCGCSYSAQKATLVTQPAYRNMKFYLYKPAKVPVYFYATFDDYLVYRDSKGVWKYASAEKEGIVPSNYVVGSVVPSVVGLKPYSAKTSSVAPIVGTPKADTGISTIRAKSPRIVYMPPSSGLEVYNPVQLTPNNTNWTQNSNFMALGKWQSSVDRIGVIYRPAIPVAWKGDTPEVIYAWTGLQWKQIDAKNSYTSALSTLRRSLYELLRYVRQVNILEWTDDDTHVLSQYSVMWGYEWMGQIFLGNEKWR